MQKKKEKEILGSQTSQICHNYTFSGNWLPVCLHCDVTGFAQRLKTIERLHRHWNLQKHFLSCLKAIFICYYQLHCFYWLFKIDTSCATPWHHQIKKGMWANVSQDHVLVKIQGEMLRKSKWKNSKANHYHQHQRVYFFFFTRELF